MKGVGSNVLIMTVDVGCRKGGFECFLECSAHTCRHSGMLCSSVQLKVFLIMWESNGTRDAKRSNRSVVG